jgi:uncharacterized membrane protein YfcA
VTPLAIAAALSVMAGAALQSAIGFGFALVAAPLLYAATSPPEGVGLTIVLGVEVSLLTLATERRRPEPHWREVWPLLAWSLPGALAGVAVLRSLSPLALQLLVTAGVLAALAVTRRAARAAAGPVHEPPRWSRPAAGLTSGALNTSTSTGGPPVVLLLMGRGIAPAKVRDTLTVVFLGFAPVSIVALAVTGTSDAVPGAGALAALVPVCALGHLAGRPVFRRLAAGSGYERVLAFALCAAVAVGLAGVLV